MDKAMYMALLQVSNCQIWEPFQNKKPVSSAEFAKSHCYPDHQHPYLHKSWDRRHHQDLCEIFPHDNTFYSASHNHPCYLRSIQYNSKEPSNNLEALSGHK